MHRPSEPQKTIIESRCIYTCYDGFKLIDAIKGFEKEINNITLELESGYYNEKHISVYINKSYEDPEYTIKYERYLLQLEKYNEYVKEHEEYVKEIEINKAKQLLIKHGFEIK